MDPSTCLICSFTGPGLHRFPRDKKRLKHWLVAIERTDLLENEDSSSIVYNSGRLCNAHFADSCFCGKGRKRLTRNALPRLSSAVMEESDISENTQENDTIQYDNIDVPNTRLRVTLESSADPGNSLIEEEHCDKILDNQPAECENGDLKSKDTIYPSKKLIEDNLVHAIKSNKKAEKIFGATHITGELMFLVKWEGANEADLIPSSFAKKHFPALLIEFYEERVSWTTPNQAEAGTSVS